jgi:type II secretory pathway component PulC
MGGQTTIGAICLLAVGCTQSSLPPEDPCAAERLQLETRLERAEQRIAELEEERAAANRPAIAASPPPVDQPVEISEHHFRVSRAFVDALFDNRSAATHARLVPVEDAGKVTGVRVFGIRSGDPLTELGLQNGDELRSLGGFALQDPESVLKAYAVVKQAQLVDLELVRRGSPLTLHYEIVDER